MKKVCGFIFSVFLIFSLLSCDIRYGFIESDFILAKDSNLPKFINATTEGYSREDLTITFTFYTLDRVKILIRGSKPNHKIFKKIIGKICSNEIIIEQEKRADYSSFPRYICISVNGVDEMFEKRERGDVLYVSDVLQKK